MKEVKLEESAYQFDAKMSLKQAIPLGLQHVCAMFVALVQSVSTSVRIFSTQTDG